MTALTEHAAQASLSESTMAHHTEPTSPVTKKKQPYNRKTRIIHKFNKRTIDKPYGVPPSKRILTPGLLRNHHSSIHSFLKYHLVLSTAQREVVFRLLRLAAYHAHVYPKARQIAQEPGCSQRTFWRTIAILKDQGLITVINRYVIREEAQISNLYVLRKLLLAIIRFLHEHSVKFRHAWLQPFLSMPGARFWRAIKKWPWTLGPPATYPLQP